LQPHQNKKRNKTKLPYVFTEQGIAMLSGLLKNEIAVKVSISIMNAFVQMRKFLLNNGQVFGEISNIKYKLLEHDKNLIIYLMNYKRIKKRKLSKEYFLKDKFGIAIV